MLRIDWHNFPDSQVEKKASIAYTEKIDQWIPDLDQNDNALWNNFDAGQWSCVADDDDNNANGDYEDGDDDKEEDDSVAPWPWVTTLVTHRWE